VTARTYATPEAFKQAIEQRLRAASKTGADFARRRQLLVFDRFLARVVTVLGEEAARLDLGDFLAFEVAPDDEHPEIQNEGMQYEGKRFQAECRLAGKVYGDPFGVDVAFGDPMLSVKAVVSVFVSGTQSFASCWSTRRQHPQRAAPAAPASSRKGFLPPTTTSETESCRRADRA
jgi:hypothetical protein